MPTDIGVHDLTSNTSHSPYVAQATSFNGGNDPYKAFDSAAGNGFWIGTGGGVDKLQLDRGNANLGLDIAPHDLTSASSHSPYVVASSTAHGSFPNYNALDGSVTSYWLGTNAGVDWWRIDWGSGNSHIIKSYWLRMNQVPEPNRAPKNWTFEGSNDASSWTVLHTVTNQTSWDNGETRYYEPTDISTAYRYHRINITANNGDASFTQICEIYLFDVPQDRSRSVVCGSYTVQVKTTANRDPKNWTLQGNNFEGAGWVTLDTQTNQTGWSNNESRTFTCAAGGAAYQAFRLNITANNGDASFTEVQELTLFQGAVTVNESISIGVSAGVAVAPVTAAAETITVDVSVSVTPATQLAAGNAIAVGVGLAVTPAGAVTGHESITIAVSTDAAVATEVAVEEDIAIGVGLSLEIRRFQAAEISIGVGLGIDLADGSGNVTPGTFRPGASSGPAGIFRAVDAGDTSPGRFRSPGGSGATPGRFKPKQ